MYDFLKKKVIIIAITALLAVMPLHAALKDPTRPPNVTTMASVSPQKIQKPSWILTSTLISAQRRTAVINDTVVSHGDRINGAKVINIQPSAVQLHVNGRDIMLMMLKKNIKSLSPAAAPRQGK